MMDGKSGLFWKKAAAGTIAAGALAGGAMLYQGGSGPGEGVGAPSDLKESGVLPDRGLESALKQHFPRRGESVSLTPPARRVRGGRGNMEAGPREGKDRPRAAPQTLTKRQAFCGLPRAERVETLKGFVRTGLLKNHPKYERWMRNCPGDPDILSEEFVCGKYGHPEPGKSCLEDAGYCIGDDGVMPRARDWWKRKAGCFVRKYIQENAKYYREYRIRRPRVPLGEPSGWSVQVVSHACDDAPEGTIWSARFGGGHSIVSDVMGYKADSRGNFVHVSGPAGKKSYKMLFDPECGTHESNAMQ